MDEKKYKIMMFIMNALENKWSVKKRKNKYIFRKKHENRKEYMENYLETFICENMQGNHFVCDIL